MDLIKNWSKTRTWLLANSIDIRNHPNEIQYQEIVKEFSLIKKAKVDKISKSLQRIKCKNKLRQNAKETVQKKRLKSVR